MTFNVYLSIYHTLLYTRNLAFQLPSIILINIFISLRDNSLSTDRYLKKRFIFFLLPVKRLQLCYLCLLTV